MSKKLIAPKPKGEIIDTRVYDKERVYVVERPGSYTLVFDSIKLGDTTNVQIRLYKSTLKKILNASGEKYDDVIKDRHLLYQYILYNGFYLKNGSIVNTRNRCLQWNWGDYTPYEKGLL